MSCLQFSRPCSGRPLDGLELSHRCCCCMLPTLGTAPYYLMTEPAPFYILLLSAACCCMEHSQDSEVRAGAGAFPAAVALIVRIHSPCATIVEITVQDG